MTADQGAVPAAGWTTRRWLPTRPDAQRGTRFGELPRFAVVGTAGTVLQLGMFVIMASYVNAALAGALSWVVSTVATNAAQSAFTFHSMSSRGAAVTQIIAFASCLVALSLATGAAVLLCEQPTPARLAALAGVNVVTGLGRFVLLRWWQQHR